MAAWGLIVAALLALGSLPFFLGLTVVLPVLGHATWHLYRKVVEPETEPAPGLPQRAAAALRGRFPGQSVPLDPLATREGALAAPLPPAPDNSYLAGNTMEGFLRAFFACLAAGFIVLSALPAAAAERAGPHLQDARRCSSG